MEISERIKLVRKEAGLSQEKFAESIGVSKISVSYYETGQRVPSQALMQVICQKYNVCFEWLSTGEGNRKPDHTKQQEIARMALAMRDADENSSRYLLIKLLSQLSVDQLDDILKMVQLMVEILEKKNKPQE